MDFSYLEIIGALASLIGVLLAVYFYYEGKRERPERRVHNVIMDGMKSAGKTTFIARLANPVTPREDLEKLASTLDSFTTFGVPICWEQTRRERHTLLHELKFTDVAGEDSSVFIQAIRQLSDSGITSVILVIVWDLSQPERNMDYLNEQRLKATYRLKESRLLINRSVIVFLNKADRIENREERERIIEAEKEKITQYFGELFGKPFDDIKFYSGSALEGDGMHYCFGEIIKALKLERNYQRITGNPDEVEDEDV